MKRTAKKILTFLCIAACIVSVIACAQKSKASLIIDEYFTALCSLDFNTAAELLGEPSAYQNAQESLDNAGTYLEYATQKAFLTFIYSGIAYEIIDEQSGVLTLSITAYNISDVLAYQRGAEREFTSSEEYLALSLGEKYVALADYEESIFANAAEVLEKRNTVIEVKVSYHEDYGYVIRADRSFFDAIAGESKNE